MRLVVITAVMLVTVGVAFTAMLAAWRERAEPGARPLVALLLGACVWAMCSLFRLRASSVDAKLLWNEVGWIGVMIIPVAWVLFALEYTGRDQFVRPRTLTLLSVVPAVTVVLAFTSQSHSLLYSGSEHVTFQGEVLINRLPGPWFWVAMSYTYALGMVGSIPILEFVFDDARPFRGQSGALLIGTLAPGVSNLLFVAGVISIPAFYSTPVAFSISGVAYLAAVKQFQLFDATPSASKHAQQLFVDQLQDGVVVVDNNGFVVDLNDSAERILGVASRSVLGQPATDAITDYDVLEASRSSSDSVTLDNDHTGQLYDVTQTEITDSHGRTVGDIFTLHDVSDYVRNRQRHEVLNRLLRHNVRTKTNLIISHAELLADDDADGDPSLIEESARQIGATAEKAREMIDLFEQRRESVRPVSLSSLLSTCVRQVRAANPEATITVMDADGDAAVLRILETAYLNVIENAVVHNDADEPRVWVRVDVGDDTVSVTVVDDGPGIDNYEQSVIESGTEKALDHSSGLGLWLVKWATEMADGDLTFSTDTTAGTAVTITTPRVDERHRDSVGEPVPTGPPSDR
jgi:PAS domain S-box-containing protein